MSFSGVQKLFFKSPEFAVVGASRNADKYGTKVLKWYISRDRRVTPIHLKEDELEGLSTLQTLSDLPSPQMTSVSIITPPKVTLDLLKQAQALNVPALWLQPGAEDDAVKQYIRDAGLESKVVLGGPCVLVSGDDIVRSLL